MAQRIQIRDEIGRLLSHIDGIDHVAVGRFKPLEVSRCPFVRVLADSETSELYSDAGQERRTLSLQIEIYVDDSDDPEAEANEIATLIEKRDEGTKNGPDRSALLGHNFVYQETKPHGFYSSYFHQRISS